MASIFVVTGLHRTSQNSVALALQVDLPQAVILQHTIDIEHEKLTRTVSDWSGVLENESIDLEHLCPTCAIREDVIPSIARLTESGRWEHIVSVIPTAASAQQICQMHEFSPEQFGGAQLDGVVNAIDGSRALADLTTNSLLAEWSVDVFGDDDRGTAEISASLIEYADVNVVRGTADQAGIELIRTLSRPNSAVVAEWEYHDLSRVVIGSHDHAAAEDWVNKMPHTQQTYTGDHVWCMTLSSDRPVHPQRFAEHIEILGSGRGRSRGCVWLASRPQGICGWDGAGGLVSIGTVGQWTPETPARTHLHFVGIHEDDQRDQLRAAFEECLVTDDELNQRGPYWDVTEDGLEPWLGEV